MSAKSLSKFTWYYDVIVFDGITVYTIQIAVAEHFSDTDKRSLTSESDLTTPS